jgi:hypothetical protein
MSNAHVPRIIDYSEVLSRLTELGYRSLYHNSGAFGFAPGVATTSRGWIGPPDASIRESVRPIVRQAPEPFDSALTQGLIRIWTETIPGTVWLMPKSHWAYELDFGHRDWLPRALQEIGIDPALLAPMNNGSAIEFNTTDKTAFARIVKQLLNQLVSSDFQLVFLDDSTICTIHTRLQLWWTTTNEQVSKQLDRVISADGNADAAGSR